jgi:hypothetical protein
VRAPAGAAEHGRGGGGGAALLLPRLGVPRRRPHLADPVPAQGGPAAAARGPRLPGPRGVRAGVRVSRGPVEGGWGGAARTAGIRLRAAQDHDLLPHRQLPLLVPAREPAGHEPPVPAPGRRRPDPPRAARLRDRPRLGAGAVPVHPHRRQEVGRCRPAHHPGPLGAARHHDPDRLPVSDPVAVGRGRAAGVLAVGGVRARGCRAAHQPYVRPAHDRQAARPRRPQPGLAVDPPVHRAGIRRGPDGGRGRAAGLGRAGPRLQPGGVPADPRRP